MKIFEIDPGQKQDLGIDLTFVVNKIQKDCSNYIDAMKSADRVLWRGIPVHLKDTPDFFIGKSRENRRPKDSSAEIQNMFDNIMDSYGFHALRSNSIFCSSSRMQAKMYGEPYMIFPTNTSEFLWSTEINDLFGSVTIYHELANLVDNNFKPNIAYAQEFVRRFRYYDENFVTALKFGNEILVNGTYYACHGNYALKIATALGLTLK